MMQGRCVACDVRMRLLREEMRGLYAEMNTLLAEASQRHQRHARFDVAMPERPIED